MPRKLKETLIYQARSLILEQGLKGRALAQALGVDDRTAREYAKHVREEAEHASPNGHDRTPLAHEPVMVPLEHHPLADLFPLMSETDFAALKADIAANGLREPTWLWQGKILDGRNRRRACHELGLQCPTRDYVDDDPLGFILSMNLHRRHLSESQRAMVAAKIANMRQGRPGEKAANLPDYQVSQSHAAGLLHISERTLRDAKKVQAEGQPEVIAAVEAGHMRVSAAAKLAEQPVAVQRQVVKVLETGAAKSVTAALQHTPAAALGGPPTRPRHRDPTPPVEVPSTRRWYVLVAACTNAFLDFGHSGGLEPLLEVWTSEERTRARGELGRIRDQLDRLDAAMVAVDSPNGQAAAGDDGPEDPADG
jgi:hypothetical protein